MAIPANVPEGTRVYVIGDVHGRADLMEQAFAKIDAFDAEQPIDRSVTVLLGDYVDRGMRSREVIDMLIAQSQRREIVAICGNHEEYMLRALHEPTTALRWLAAGGRETLHSYDVNVPMNVDIDSAQTVMLEFNERLPEEHKDFIMSLQLYWTIGEYGFVHAGLRPGIALHEQLPSDLMTIRQPFLDYQEPHDFVIVHGHTPVSTPDFRHNRINIDTGAYITGKLTCLVLERGVQMLM
jgi:serine/threonine protein phosphatase 1